jgi:hypothetical protein
MNCNNVIKSNAFSERVGFYCLLKDLGMETHMIQ